MKYIFTAFLVALRIIVDAQEFPQEMMEKIRGNIISYHIRNALDADLNLSQEFIQFDASPSFEKLMPAGKRLVMNIMVLGEAYPVKGFILYRVQKHGFQFERNDSTWTYSFSSFANDDDYLVAYNPATADIKYISGNFFKTRVAADFRLNYSDPSSLIGFIQLKLYHLHPLNIKFWKSKKGRLWYTANNGSDKTQFHIVIDPGDPDAIRIQYLKKYYVY